MSLKTLTNTRIRDYEKNLTVKYLFGKEILIKLTFAYF